MNPLQEKLTEIVKGLKELQVENYGNWKVDRNLACAFVEKELTTLINLTLEEAINIVEESDLDEVDKLIRDLEARKI